MSLFKLHTDLTPKGDQPHAIKNLSEGILSNKKHQVLLGVTGSGKTFTMAHVIANTEKPSNSFEIRFSIVQDLPVLESPVSQT